MPNQHSLKSPRLTNLIPIGVWIGVLLLTLLVRPAIAHEESKYRVNVGTEVLSALSYGPQAAAYQNRHITMSIRTEKPLTLESAAGGETEALVLGNYRTYKRNVDLELKAIIEKSRLEMEMTLGQLEAYLHEWEEMYESIPFLKKYKQQTKQLRFHEDEGFVYYCLLEKDFKYVAAVEIGYDPETHKLSDQRPVLKEVTQFIRAMESDARSRQWHANNKSGLPVLISTVEKDGKREFHARHPMHEIIWSRSGGFLHYAFIDSLSDVQALPEIKKLMKDSRVANYLASQTGEVRINIQGNPKEGFRCLFIGTGLGKNLVARWVNKKVVVEDPAN